MLNNYLGILTLHTPLDDMKSLIKYRNHASLPIGGRYKIIDFHLSNITNADIVNVALVGADRNNNILSDHIGTGASWDLDRKNNGITFLNKYRGTLDTDRIEILENNLRYFLNSQQKNIVLINTAMLYNIDLKAFIKEHEEGDRDVTIIYKKVSDAKNKFYQCDILEIDEYKNVMGHNKNFNLSDSFNLSLGVIIISKAILLKLLKEDIARNSYMNLKDSVMNNLNKLRVKGSEFRGFVANINSVIDYHEFNLKLLNPIIRNEIFNPARPIYTRRKDTPPTLYKKGCVVENSLISNGCKIEGTVKNSILGRRVTIDEGVNVENCVILQRCHIKTGSTLRNVILDGESVIEEYSNIISSPNYPFVAAKENIITTKMWDILIKKDKPII